MALLVSKTQTSQGGDPYALTAEELALIPWHSSSGAWGDAVPIVPPTAPTTTRQVTVSNQSEFQTESAVEGTEITIDTSISESTHLAILADNIDVIVPPGVSVGMFNSGAGFPSRSGIRIRGTTPGSHSGGRVGRVYLNVDDLILDGIDMNSAGNFGGSDGLNSLVISGARHGIYNCRIVSANYLHQGSSTGLIIKNSNLYASAWTRAQCDTVLGSGEAANQGGWAIRFGGGPLTILNSDIRTTRYHTLRTGSSTGLAGQLMYIGNSRLVESAEGKLGWIFRDVSESGAGPANGFIMENSELYGHSDCGGFAEFSIYNFGGDPCLYSRVRNNDWFSSVVTYNQSLLNTEDARTGDHDWSVGNTFSAWSAWPDYDMNSTGSPEGIPLPGDLFPLSYGEGSCVGFPDS